MSAADPSQESKPSAFAHDLSVRHLEVATRYLYNNLLPLPLVVVGMGVLLTQWFDVRPVIGWAVATTAAWGVTIACLYRFQHDERRAQRLLQWTIAICVSLFISSFIFAGVAWLFWLDDARLNNVLLYSIVAAGLACAGAQSAPSAPVLISNLVPYCIVFVGMALFQEKYPNNIGIVFLQSCYIVLVALYARTVWLLTHEMLVLRGERRSLVTRLQRALDDATVARQRAETASRAKSDFLANMSHELRTPLNAVLGFSEVIKDRLFGDQAMDRYAEYAGNINMSGRHLLGLINDILDLAKIEAGKFELDETQFDLCAPARDVLRLVETQAHQKGLRLTLDAPETLTVKADERALRQIMANLLSNAVKFTPPAGLITLRLARAANGNLTIAVADTGVGIKPEDLAHVLESFGQARHELATTEERGTGLGLPIVKGLAAAHGGTIALESKLGQGTTVTVELPAQRIVASAGAAAPCAITLAS